MQSEQGAAPEGRSADGTVGHSDAFCAALTFGIKAHVHSTHVAEINTGATVVCSACRQAAAFLVQKIGLLCGC